MNDQAVDSINTVDILELKVRLGWQGAERAATFARALNWNEHVYSSDSCALPFKPSVA